MTKFTTADLEKLGYKVEGDQAVRIKPGEKKPKAKIRSAQPTEISKQATTVFPFIFIPGNVPSGKNHHRIVASDKLIGSAAKLRYKKEAADYYRDEQQHFLSLIEGLGTPVTVFLKFVRKTRQTFDFNNMTQLVADMMQEHAWISNDDSRTVVFYPTPHFQIDKENPGVYIFL